MFGADAALCGVCAYHDDCKTTAQAATERLRKLMDVGNVGAMHVTVTPTPVAQPRIAKPAGTAKNKLNALINQINKAAPDAIERLSQQENPFTVSSKPAYLKPLVDIRLSSDASEARQLRLLMDVFEKTAVEAEKLLALFDEALEVIAKQKETLYEGKE